MDEPKWFNYPAVSNYESSNIPKTHENINNKIKYKNPVHNVTEVLWKIREHHAYCENFVHFVRIHVLNYVFFFAND